MKYLGTVLGIISMTLTFIWYDWKLALIIFIALFGNNIDQSNRVNDKFRK